MAISVAFCLIFSIKCRAQAGAVDPSFRPQIAGYIYCSLIDSQGRILVGGGFTSVNGQSRSNIVRLLPDGQIDPTFETHVNGSVQVISANRNRIAISGYFTSVSGVALTRLACLNFDGSVVDTFVPKQSPEPYPVFFSAAIDTSNRVLFVRGRELIRLNPDGSHDTNFHVKVGPRTIDSIATVKLLPDGRIVIGGEYTEIDLFVAKHVSRLFEDGSVDTTFNASGQLLGSYIRELEPLANDELYVGGSVVARLTNRGRINTNFAVYGYTYVGALAAQEDRRLLIGGTFTRGFGRVLTNGISDVPFNQNSGADSWVSSIMLQQDGKIVVAGAFTNINGVSQPYLARLLNDWPVLETERIDDTRLRMFWPAAYTNFFLRSAAEATSSNWPIVLLPPVITGNYRVVTNVIDSSNRFFRLRRN
jgi:uncharacterized delta-60 repeat protein